MNRLWMVVAALVFGVSLVAAALIHAGRYTVVMGRGDFADVYVVDRFTGAVRVCNSTRCVEHQGAGPKAAQTVQQGMTQDALDKLLDDMGVQFDARR
jgi:hypothetical protein